MHCPHDSNRVDGCLRMIFDRNIYTVIACRCFGDKEVVVSWGAIIGNTLFPTANVWIGWISWHIIFSGCNFSAGPIRREATGMTGLATSVAEVSIDTS